MKRVILICLIFFYISSNAQDSSEKKKSWTIAGYLKDLEWVRLDKDFTNAYFTNLVHNRINLKWKPSSTWEGRFELRNRLYWGDDVRADPNFKTQLRNPNEAVNAGVEWMSTESAVLYSNVDRLWLEYRQPKWNVRGGRQRINWGIANNWNPNDLFNTYNFLNFDYTERPGCDAIKFQYMVNDLSNIEAAYANTNYRSIYAVRYFTNYKKYDLQVNVGMYESDFTAGLGWAGSLGNIGFKGESQFFSHPHDSASFLNLTMEADYMSKNGWYFSSAFLFNQQGENKPIEDWSKLNFQATPLNLMPLKWSFLLNCSSQFTPLFNGSMNVIYSPGVNMLILFPAFTYNLKTNLDLDLGWQAYFAERKKFESISHTGFIRLKWSF